MKTKNCSQFIFALFFLYNLYNKVLYSYGISACYIAMGSGLLSYKIKDTRLILFARYFLYASAIGGIIVVGGKLEPKCLESTMLKVSVINLL
jgi:hypothetical protein